MDCDNCHGPVRSDNRYGLCRRTPECLRKVKQLEHQKNYDHRWRQIIVTCARRRAERFGWPFSLTVDDLPTVPETCPVLGIPLVRHTGGRMGPYEDSPSLDRIIPERGYVSDNIQWISFRANKLRNNATIEELAKVVSFFTAQARESERAA